MRKVSVIVVLVVLMVGGGIAASQRRGTVPVDSEGKVIVTPEMKDKARRRRELLETPGNLVYKLAPKVDKEHGAGRPAGNDGRGTRFKARDEISYEVSVTNTLSEPVTITLPETYESFQPQLFKDGELLPYNERVSQVLESRKTFGAVMSVRTDSFEPHQARTLGYFNLKDWYEPLGPGSYQLLLKYELEPGMNPLELPPVNFEVVP